MTRLLIFILTLTIMSCHNSTQIHPDLDIQGHRGCRGLMPENTIEGFKKAMDLGVRTLELDLVVNGDKQVVISHEPFFSHSISTAPDGHLISESKERSHNIYKLTQSEIESYDVGMRPHKGFELQKKMPATKPLLSKMVQEVENYASSKGYPAPLYNMEIKRTPAGDTIFHPAMEEFADIAINTIVAAGVMDRTTVQCFDVPTLQYLHQKHPNVRLVYLVENESNFRDNFDLLGFQPYVYSPYHKLVSSELVDYCKQHKIQLIPWTVNDAKESERLIRLGVDGIISDYPDMVIEVYQSLKK